MGGAHERCRDFEYASCQAGKGAAAPPAGRCPKFAGCLLSSRRLVVSGKVMAPITDLPASSSAAAAQQPTPAHEFATCLCPSRLALRDDEGCTSLDPASGGTDAQPLDSFLGALFISLLHRVLGLIAQASRLGQHWKRVQSGT